MERSIKSRAFALMKRWCDSLLEYEVRSRSPYVDGALFCPACHVAHGRAGDLAFPLAALWAETGERRYLETAERLVEWTEFNLRDADGLYRNDAGNLWRGTSAFSALALGDALIYYGDRLPARVSSRWREIYLRLSESCVALFDTLEPNINYFAGAAALFAQAWTITGERRYLAESDRWERFCRARFDGNGLFYGEGRPIDGVTAKGCRFIDMGYNLEESLPLLVRHAVLTGDSEKLGFYRARFLDHLEFLLPDGAIDNSFGTRHNKWTYWGSRTSDGIVGGLAPFLAEPVFAEACGRVLSLYERCTGKQPDGGENGSESLLGLPMAMSAGEPVCLHHSFCHAKALAALLCEAAPASEERAKLPCEEEYGVKSFQSGNVLLVSYGGWRATFSASDAVCYGGAETGGGSMTLLRHRDAGTVCAATMREYAESEPLNMQYLRKSSASRCMTPRLETSGSSTVTDSGARLEHGEGDGFVRVAASGGGWRAEYVFRRDRLEISVESERPAKLIVPVVCPSSETAERTDGALKLGGIRVESGEPLAADLGRREFNQVGGFEYVPLETGESRRASVTITAV